MMTMLLIIVTLLFGRTFWVLRQFATPGFSPKLCPCVDCSEFEMHPIHSLVLSGTTIMAISLRLDELLPATSHPPRHPAFIAYTAVDKHHRRIHATDCPYSKNQSISGLSDQYRPRSNNQQIRSSLELTERLIYLFSIIKYSESATMNVDKT